MKESDKPISAFCNTFKSNSCAKNLNKLKKYIKNCIFKKKYASIIYKMQYIRINYIVIHFIFEKKRLF